MNRIMALQAAIYNQFHNSLAGPQHFFLDVNRDAYAAYYTSMYLVQDTAEAVYTHMGRDFSPDPMLAYIEFWGVMQAIDIQQDAIFQLHKAILGSTPTIPHGSAWHKIRDTRHLCAGHPANRGHGVSHHAARSETRRQHDAPCMTNTEINPDRPLRGRRLSWEEFTRLTGRPRPEAANDNEKKVDGAHKKQLINTCLY
ncbi:hypothetical protein QD357_01840 [Rhizobium sp. BR 317]|uniref:hypothetical protein n=1 Tax=Rhizobium sp. BR 317 TaxID=3040015 RepID=UPI0039BEF1F1